MKSFRFKKGFALKTILISAISVGILGVGYYCLRGTTIPSWVGDNSKQVGKQQITINGNYGYELTVPDGYYIESSKWAGNNAYLSKSVIRDFSNNKLLTITYGANGWEPNNLSYQNIDGVAFEVIGGPLACGVISGTVGYPKDEIPPSSDNPNLENQLTVEIIVGCEGKNKELQSKTIQKLVDSIKWSPELKNVLSGRKPTFYIPRTKFGGE
jgi:hypothetical protein